MFPQFNGMAKDVRGATTNIQIVVTGMNDTETNCDAGRIIWPGLAGHAAVKVRSDWRKAGGWRQWQNVLLFNASKSGTRSYID